MMECVEKHFKSDCDHVWGRELHDVYFMGGECSSVLCVKCGTAAIHHDARRGP